MKIGTTFVHPAPEAMFRTMPGIEWVDLESPCDVIMTQWIPHYRQIRHLPTPKIIVEHTLHTSPVKAEWIGDTTVKRVVFSTAEQVWNWGAYAEMDKVAIIPVGHDFSKFPKWEGGKKAVLNATNAFRERDPYCGYSTWSNVTHDLDRILLGFRNEGIQGAIGMDSYENVHAWMRVCNVFLNTTHFSTAPNALIEAMAVGIPIVSTNTFFSETVLGNGAVLTNNESELRAAVIRLIEKPDNPHMERNQRLARDLFDLEQSHARWRRVFESL